MRLRIEPLKDQDGHYAYEFINESSEDDIPKQYIDIIDQGIRDQMRNGVLAGHRLMGIRATLVGGSAHETDSSDMAFKIAAGMALREAVLNADPALLEPVMTVEVVTPEEFMGDVVGDLNRRRDLFLVWTKVHQAKSSAPRWRYQKCLVIRRICAAAHKVAQPTQWNLLITLKYRKTLWTN